MAIRSERLPEIAAAIARVRLSRNTNQTISNELVVAVSWDTTEQDTGGFSDIGGNPTRVLTAVGNQTWCAHAHLRYAPNATGIRSTLIYHRNSGGTLLASADLTNTTLGGVLHMTTGASGVFEMSDGDYLEVNCFQDSGGDLDIVPGSPTHIKVEAFLVDPIDSTAAGGGVTGNAKIARLSRAASQSIPSSGAHAVSWDTVDEDIFNLHDTGAPTKLLTATEDSTWLITAGVQFAINSTGQRVLYLAQYNSSDTLLSLTNTTHEAVVFEHGLIGSRIVTMAPGDYILVLVTQNTGGPLNISTLTPSRTRAEILRIDDIGTGGGGGGGIDDIVRLTRTATQSIPTGTSGDTISWDTENEDTANVHDTGAPTKILTAVEESTWLITASVDFPINGTGSRQLAIRHFDSGDVSLSIRGPAVDATSSPFPAQLTTSLILKMAAGDYLTALVVQNSGSPLDIASFSRTHVEAVRLI